MPDDRRVAVGTKSVSVELDERRERSAHLEERRTPLVVAGDGLDEDIRRPRIADRAVDFVGLQTIFRDDGMLELLLLGP